MGDPYVLLVPAGDPLAQLGRKLTPADLARRDLIGKDCGTASQRALAAALSDYGLGAPRIRAHDLREVQALVRRGLGVAVVPRLLLDGPDRDDRHASGRPLHPRPPHRTDDALERSAHAGGRVRRSLRRA